MTGKKLSDFKGTPLNYNLEHLFFDEWENKRSEIFETNKYKCQHCHNYKFLKNASIGYLIKINKQEYSETEGEYKINSWGGHNTIRVKLADNYPSFEHTNHDLIEVSVEFPREMIFNEKKFYLIYLDPNHNGPYDVLGVVEVDNPTNNYPWYYTYRSRMQNPFRKLKYFKTAKFILIKGLYVHHVSFEEYRLPWGYNQKLLKCLCQICLEKYVKKRPVSLINSKGKVISKLITCPRCNGQGVFHQHKHVNNGLCFECKGNRFIDYYNNPLYHGDKIEK